ECEVVDLQPPFRLAYTWHASSERAASLVTWTLAPVPGGTRLRLAHTRADEAATARCAGTRGSDAAAWEHRLAALRAVLGVMSNSQHGGETWRTTGSFDGAHAW